MGGSDYSPHTLEYEDQVMNVVVKSRRPQCWTYKQLGHFYRSCPQKTKPISPTLIILSSSKSRIRKPPQQRGVYPGNLGRKKYQVKSSATTTPEKRNHLPKLPQLKFFHQHRKKKKYLKQKFKKASSGRTA